MEVGILKVIYCVTYRIIIVPLHASKYIKRILLQRQTIMTTIPTYTFFFWNTYNNYIKRKRSSVEKRKNNTLRRLYCNHNELCV